MSMTVCGIDARALVFCRWLYTLHVEIPHTSGHGPYTWTILRISLLPPSRSISVQNHARSVILTIAQRLRRIWSPTRGSSTAVYLPACSHDLIAS